MAVAAKKVENELRYAPATRVYSQSAAAPAQQPADSPALPAEQRLKPDKSARTDPVARPRPAVNAGRIFLVTLSVLAGAALLILILVRYAMICQEYAVVNDLKEKIEESQREVAALNVQLNAAVSLEEARAAALEAGMEYPTAEQIIRIQADGKAQSGGQSAP